MNDSTLRLIAKHNANELQTLQICGSSLSFDAICALEMCSNLKCLSLVDCQLEDGCVDSLCRKLHTQLVDIDLSYNKKIGDATIERIVHFCHNLRNLKLLGCIGISNASLLSIAKPRGTSESPKGTVATLSTLDLSECSGISDRGLSCLLESCKGLEVLSLRTCQYLTDLAFVGLAEHSLHDEKNMNSSECHAPCVFIITI